MPRGGAPGELPAGAGRGLRVALVASEFNRRHVDALLRSARARLRELGAGEALLARVPGALELPLAARWAARSGGVDAVVALGCVIRGETGHYDLVCRGALDGLLKVSLEEDLPVLFGVLTVDNEAQARERSSGGPLDAGRHAAATAVAMARLRRTLGGRRPAGGR